MSLVSDNTFHAWRFEQVSFIECVIKIIWILLIAVCLLILSVFFIFEGKALQPHLLSIHYYSFIEWFWSHAIFHSPHNLEFIIIDHAYVSNCCSGPGIIFILILFNKSTTNLGEVVFICVFEFHLMFLFDGVDVHSHHLG